MEEDPVFQIRRADKNLGKWNDFQIRQYIASGALVPSDEFCDPESGKWRSLIPQHRRKWNIFDWSGDEDLQWYFIKDGYIHGPRLIQEIFAFLVAEYIDEDTLITCVMGEAWFPLSEVLPDDVEDAHEMSAGEFANEALDALVQGDKVAAGISGFKALGKFWSDFTAPETITSNRLFLRLNDGHPEVESILEQIQQSGFIIHGHEITESEGDLRLILQFSSIEEAEKVRDELNYTKLSEGFLLEFHNQPDSTD